jgi:hypothetical protein
MIARARRDRAFDSRRVEIERLEVGLDGHRRRPGLGDSEPGGDIGIRRHDHFVASSDTEPAQDQRQCIESVGHADAMGRPAIRGKLILERLDLRPEDPSIGYEYTLPRSIEFRANFRVPGAEIEERNRRTIRDHGLRPRRRGPCREPAAPSGTGVAVTRIARLGPETRRNREYNCRVGILRSPGRAAPRPARIDAECSR